MSFWEMIFIRWANKDSWTLTSWLQLVWWYISIYNPWDWGRRTESFRLACATRWNTVKKKQNRPSWSTHFCVAIFLSVSCVASIHVYHQHPFKNKTPHVCSVPCLQSPRTLQQCLQVYRWCFFPVRGEGSGKLPTDLHPKAVVHSPGFQTQAFLLLPVSILLSSERLCGDWLAWEWVSTWSPLLHCVYGSSTWFVQAVVTEYSGPDSLETGSAYCL